MEAVVMGERVGTVIADPKTWHNGAYTREPVLN
jgi:hypothetical protein